jgi:hypothetical protein
MTTSTTKDHPPDASSDGAIDPPAAHNTHPGPAAPDAAPDLESRIRWRRAEMIGRLRELRVEAHLAAEAGDKLKAKLSEVGQILTNDAVDGWESLGETVKSKLERWLAESELSLATENLPAKNGDHDDHAGRALDPSGSARARRARRPVTAK